MDEKETMLIGDLTTDGSLVDKARPFLSKAKPGQEQNQNRSNLKTLCLQAVRQNMEFYGPRLQEDFPDLLEEIASLNLGLNDSVRFIDHEGFWKGETLKIFGENDCCDLASSGKVSWKRLFCEKSLSVGGDGKKGGIQLLSTDQQSPCVHDYAFSLDIQNAVASTVLGGLSMLQNLMSLHIQYGNQNEELYAAPTPPSKRASAAGPSSFKGMQPSDVKSLAMALKSMRCLCSLSLTNSQIDDDLVRLFVGELNRNSDRCEEQEVDCFHIRDTLVELDLSHNKITTEGFRLIAKCFFDDEVVSHGDDESSTISILATLKLVGNRLRAEGARTLSRLLKTNCSLITLDVRMNRLDDAGGELLMDGLRHNIHLKNLSIASNALGSLTILSLCKLLHSNKVLEILDLSCSHFQDTDLAKLAIAMKHTGTCSLTSLDLRGNLVSNENVSEALRAIDEAVKKL